MSQLTNELSGDGPIGSNHVSLSQLTYDAIRQRILTGRYRRGERLVAAVIAEELGVSRIPVREALKQLGEQGFVENIPRRGAIVAMPSAKDFFEMFDVRVMLERLCARLAAENRTDTDLERMRSFVGAAAAAKEEEDWTRLGALNWKFHEALAEAGRNTHLVGVIHDYGYRLAWIYQSAGSGGDPVCQQKDHSDLLAAIENGDADGAEAISIRHAVAARQAYVEVLGED
jgi:DNA-binding GntR family transcriptional regulator